MKNIIRKYWHWLDNKFPVGRLRASQTGRNLLYHIAKVTSRFEAEPGKATLFVGAADTMRTGNPAFVEQARYRVQAKLKESLLDRMEGAAKYEIGLHEDGINLLRKAVCHDLTLKNMKLLMSRLDQSNSDLHAAEILYLCDEILKFQPLDEYTLCRKGLALMAFQRYEEARELFREMLRLFKGQSYIKVNYALALSFECRYEESLTELQSIQLEDKFLQSDLWYKIGLCNFKLGHYVKAKEIFIKSLSFNDQNEDSLLMLRELRQELRLGIDTFENGFMDRAYPFLRYEMSYEFPPALATLYYYSDECLREHDPQIIERAVERVSGQLPRDLILQVQGGVLYDLGRKDEGCDLMRQAIEINSSQENNYYVLASRLMLWDGREDEAHTLYNILLQLNPSNMNALIGKADYMVKRNQMQDAKVLIKKVLDINPEISYAHTIMGFCCEKAGDYEAALKEYTLARYYGQTYYDQLWMATSECLNKMGRISEANYAAAVAIVAKTDQRIARSRC